MRSKKFYYFMQNWSSYPLKSFFICFDYHLFYLLDLKKAMYTAANIDYLLLFVFLNTKDGMVKKS